ncbi:hypothetical protein RJ498_002839 [Pluralibacter gergoviae]
MDTSMRYPHLILLALMLFGFLLLGSTAHAVDSAVESPTEMLRRAEILDLNGSPAAARKIYDALERSSPNQRPSVPSAINQFAVNNLDQAWDYFTQIQQSGLNSDREYASLWLALLYTKEKGKLPVGKDRDFLLPNLFLTPVRREIARMYRGEFPVNEFVRFINGSSINDRRDELTEIIFFTTAYLKYVAKNPAQAAALVRDNKSKLYPYSLEKPLLEMGKP